MIGNLALVFGLVVFAWKTAGHRMPRRFKLRVDSRVGRLALPAPLPPREPDQVEILRAEVTIRHTAALPGHGGDTVIITRRLRG